MVCNTSVGETTTGFWAQTPTLAKLLEHGIFTSLTTEIGQRPVNVLSMCNGELLLNCEVTSEFGSRIHPLRRRHHVHTGIDLAAPAGSPIIAPSDGVVKTVSRTRGYGVLVVLDHGFAWTTRYAHLKKSYVKKGQIVKKGDILAEVGSTGTATGPHLHFEMRYFGSIVNPRNYFAMLRNANDPVGMFANR